jgi:hypothetical protein
MERPSAENMDSAAQTRIELVAEYKYLHKQCACGNEFRTAIPRKLFKNPDDESLEINVTASGSVSGYPDIDASDVQARIEQKNCGDKEQHPEENI